MRQFLAYFNIGFQNSNVARGERWIWLIMEIVPVFIMMSVWGNLALLGKVTNAFADQMILYYVLVLFINRLVGIEFADWVIEHIKDGQISIVLLRPMSYQVYLLAHELAWRFTGTIQSLPIYVLFLPKLFALQGLEHRMPEFFLAIGIITISCFLRFYITFLIAIAAFWMDEARALIHVRWMAEGFLGGAWLPLSFYGSTLVTIASWSPFFVWIYVPIQLITGNMSFADGVMFGMRAIVWAIVLGVVSQVMWGKALKKYSAVGG